MWKIRFDESQQNLDVNMLALVKKMFYAFTKAHSHPDDTEYVQSVVPANIKYGIVFHNAWGLQQYYKITYISSQNMLHISHIMILFKYWKYMN